MRVKTALHFLQAGYTLSIRRSRLHLQHKMAFMEFQQSRITHFAKFNGQSAALDGEIVGELLTGERNIKFIGSVRLRLGRKIGHELCSRCPLAHMGNLFTQHQIFACQLT
mgnify:FL=1